MLAELVGRTPDGFYFDAQICRRGHVQGCSRLPVPREAIAVSVVQNVSTSALRVSEPIRGMAVDTEMGWV